MFEPACYRSGDDASDPTGSSTASEFDVDPDLRAVVHPAIRDRVHDGQDREVSVDSDALDGAVDGENLIARLPSFAGAYEYAITEI